MTWGRGSHGTTYGGNPVCIASAVATLELIEQRYLENARKMGDYIFGRIHDWPKHFKIVGDVRGKGLMIGTEIVRDQKTKEKAVDLRDAVVNKAFYKGLLTLSAGGRLRRNLPWGSYERVICSGIVSSRLPVEGSTDSRNGMPLISRYFRAPRNVPCSRIILAIR